MLCLFLQLYGSQIILPKEYALPVRSFAKEAARPDLKGDGESLPLDNLTLN